MDPKELIAALGVLADPNASDEDKAAALDKLSAYFNSLLDGAKTEGASETEEPYTEPKTDSETGESKPKDDAKKDETEKDSALAVAYATIDKLTARVAKLEKASAVGAAPRVSKPTVLPRVDPTPPPKDHVTSMIEAAGRNTLRNLSK